jgi:catechol 2,3-dioxygenase-like lactoylglutathione lyase family enzyme
MLNYSKAFSSYSVNDLKQARDFYEKKLGLEVKETPEGLSVKAGKDFEVFLYPKDKHQAATFTVLNFQVSNIEETVDKLASAGVTFLHYEGDLQTDKKGIFRGNGPTIAWFADPAGNILSVVEDSSRKN